MIYRLGLLVLPQRFCIFLPRAFYIFIIFKKRSSSPSCLQALLLFCALHNPFFRQGFLLKFLFEFFIPSFISVFFFLPQYFCLILTATFLHSTKIAQLGERYVKFSLISSFYSAVCGFYWGRGVSQLFLSSFLCSGVYLCFLLIH